MRFPERELTPYAEPVLATELSEGSVCFSVTFVDDDLHIPVIETLAFVGKSDDGLLLFQDIESHRQGISRDSATNDHPATFFRCSEDQLKSIFEYEHALDELLRCFLRRQSSGNQEGKPGTE